MTEIIEVHGLYARSWKGVLNEASFVHPAKISFNLAEYIYRFAIEKGMLEQGSTVLDPFGGICGTAFHAMVFGMNWYGVELEQKFVELGQANIEAWNKRYAGTLPNWGSASLVQGDSRKLGEVLATKCDVSISSPPYADQEKGYGDRPNRWEKVKDNPNFKGRTHWKENDRPNEYGSAHGQLGNLPEGKLQESLDAAISSPPYVSGGHHKDIMGAWNTNGRGQGVTKDQAGYNLDNQNNLGNLAEGNIDAVVSSPPYAAARIGETSGAEQVGHGANYGGEVGQLGGMAEGNVDAVVSSPPYAETVMGATDYNARMERLLQEPFESLAPRWQREVKKYLRTHHATSQHQMTSAEYGTAEGQLGGLKDEGFDEVVFDVAVSSPPYSEQYRPTSDKEIAEHLNQAKPKGGGAFKKYEGSQSEGNLAALDMTEGFDSVFNAALSSPPYEGQVVGHGKEKKSDVERRYQGFISDSGEKLTEGRAKGLKAMIEGYGSTSPDHLGNVSGDTFWSASKTIVSQVHQLLKPGGYSFWIVKNFVRKKQIVNFVGQWQQLCEACGFETLYEIRAWQVDEHGTQQGMEGQHKKLVTSRKSFFRRLHESKYPETSIDYECVLVMRKIQSE